MPSTPVGPRRVAVALAASALLVAASCSRARPGPEAADGPTLPALAFSRVQSPPLDVQTASAEFGAIVAPGENDGWVVVGSSLDERNRAAAAIWRSPDGVTWSAAALPPGGQTEQRARHATRHGADLVVVGETGVGPALRARAWVGPAGGDLAVVTSPAFGGPTPLSIDTVAAGPLGLFAAGIEERQGGDSRAAIWRSEDGRSWQRLPAAEQVINARRSPRVRRILVTPSGIIAVGTVQAGDHTDAAAWFSPDGRSWSPADGSRAGFAREGDSTINDVVATDDGFLAVGSVDPDGRRYATVWKSADGRAWEQVGDATFELRPRGTDTYGISIAAIDRVADGFVAVGGGPVATRVWLSTDGRSWREVTLPENAERSTGVSFGLLAATPDAFLTGDGTAGTPHLLLRSDGRWTEPTATSDAFPVPRPALYEGGMLATAGGVSFAATAYQGAKAMGATTARSLLWSSPDGREWRRVVDGGVFDSAYVADLGARDGGLVAVGGDASVESVTSGGNPGARIWTSPDGTAWSAVPEDVVTFRPGITHGADAVATKGQRTVTVGTGFPKTDIDGVVWVSDDGQSWRRVAVPSMGGAGDQRLTGICVLGDTFVAVGHEAVGATRDGAAWVSADGETWERAGGQALVGPGDQAISGCISTAGAVVAVGYSSRPGAAADAAAWISQDGRRWTRVASAAFAGPGAQYLYRGVADGRSLYVVGSAAAGEEEDVALWRSADAGRSWRRVRLPATTFRGSQSQVAGRVVVAGRSLVIGGVVDGNAAIWTAPLR